MGNVRGATKPRKRDQKSSIGSRNELVTHAVFLDCLWFNGCGPNRKSTGGERGTHGGSHSDSLWRAFLGCSCDFYSEKTGQVID